MQYVLGNMLNGGGINPDGLSLDLQFAADKTLTARRGPTPTFTRSSGDNGGTTYFGPLVDFDEATAFSTTGISNGRASWFKSYEGTDITISYTGARWRVVTVDNGDEVTYLAAPGSEWRPDQADWSGQDLSVTTSSTFGIVKAANNEPRFDHDPVTLACRGLLVEEGRTNLMTQSEQWIGTLSGPLTPTITADTTTAPDGLLSADTLSGSTGTAFDGSLNATYRILSVSSSTTHTFSIYVKSLGVATQAEIRLRDNSTGASGQTLDTSLTSSWKRISVTLTTGAATTSVRCIIQNTNGDIAIWGAQLEAGSFPTSYIPTTTGTLARSADVCSITGGDFTSFYNPVEGSFACNYSIPAGFTGNRYAASIEDTVGGTQNGFVFRNTNNATSFIAGGGYVSTIGAVTTTASKHILAYSGLTEFVYVKDSVVGTTTGSGTRDPSLPVRMSIGSLEGFFGYLCGHIAAIRYYKKRLPNAKLAQLTV
jgi:hypothetical protein